VREIEGLRRELAGYHDESDIWRESPGVPNSAGTLALHLAGNLQHFIGAVLGGSGYVRDRDAEFSLRDLPRVKLLAELDRAERAVEGTFARLTEEDLEKPFPIETAGMRLPTALFLLQLSSHLAYHLGQVDYHRRAVAGESGSVGSLALADLGSEALT